MLTITDAMVVMTTVVSTAVVSNKNPLAVRNQSAMGTNKSPSRTGPRVGMKADNHAAMRTDLVATKVVPMRSSRQATGPPKGLVDTSAAKNMADETTMNMALLQGMDDSRKQAMARAAMVDVARNRGSSLAGLVRHRRNPATAMEDGTKNQAMAVKDLVHESRNPATAVEDSVDDGRSLALFLVVSVRHRKSPATAVEDLVDAKTNLMLEPADLMDDVRNPVSSPAASTPALLAVTEVKEEATEDDQVVVTSMAVLKVEATTVVVDTVETTTVITTMTTTSDAATAVVRVGDFEAGYFRC